MSKGRFDRAGLRVVVTGAASGIGRATALALAARNARLELCDIDERGLAEVAEQSLRAGAPEVHRHVCDVADATQVERMASEVHGRADAVDVLINNAGVGALGGFFETELTDWHWILGVNLLGVVHCVRAFGRSMIERGQGGRIVNIASASAFMNLVPLTAYGSSKYALFGLSEALRQELAPAGVAVSVVCPAIVRTPLADRLRLRTDTDATRERARLAELLARRGIAAERVAQAILQAIARGDAVVPVGRDAWALYWLKRVAPQLLPKIVSWRATRATETTETS